MVEMSERLKRARIEKGLTQGQLAELIGVEPGSVSRWESGDASPRPAKMPKISEVLGKPIAWFTEAPEHSDVNDKLAALEARIRQMESAKQVAAAPSVESIVHLVDDLVDSKKLKRVQASIAQYFLCGDEACLQGLSEQQVRLVLAVQKAL